MNEQKVIVGIFVQSRGCEANYEGHSPVVVHCDDGVWVFLSE